MISSCAPQLRSQALLCLKITTNSSASRASNSALLRSSRIFGVVSVDDENDISNRLIQRQAAACSPIMLGRALTG